MTASTASAGWGWRFAWSGARPPESAMLRRALPRVLQAVGGGERGTGLRGFSSSEGFSVTRALGIKSDRELRLEVLQDELSNAEEVRDKDGKVTRTVRQSAFEYGIKGAGVESSMDLTEQQLQGGSGLRAEYEHVHTFDASELDLSAIVPGTPSKAMISMVQNGPNRGSTIPADWKAFKSGAAVDVPGMLATLDSIFATDAKTRAVIADLKTRYTAAQVQLAEAMKMPEQPDWKQLSAVGAPFAEFLGEVKKVYDAEAALKRPADAELMAGKEKEYKEEHAQAVQLQQEFWKAQDEVLGAVAHALFEIGVAEDMYERIEKDQPVTIDEVLIRKPDVMIQIDKEISEFDFGAETKARLVNVDLQPLEGFYSTLTKVVQAKASA